MSVFDRGLEEGPSEGKLLGVKSDCRLTEAAIIPAGGVRKLLVWVEVGREATGCPPPHPELGREAEVVMAPNCLLVAARLPLAFFFLASEVAEGAGPRVG